MSTITYSPIYRIMHWLIAFCMLFLLLTIILRNTWLSKEHIALIIQGFLPNTDASLTEEQTVQLARQIRKPMWQWHIYAGYALTGLYSIRLMLPFFGQMKFPNPFENGLAVKDKLRLWVHVIFYVFVGISLLTGLLIEFGPKDIKDVMETIHKLSIYYLLSFIVLHFGGILMTEISGKEGIVSKMIGGGK